MIQNNKFLHFYSQKINSIFFNQEINIFSNKMQFQRYPLSHKQNEYVAKKSPLKSFQRRQQHSFYQKQNLPEKDASYIEKNNSILDTQKSFLYKNIKHIKSQMMYDNQFDYQVNNHQTTLNPAKYDAQSFKVDKTKFEDDRKYNVKHMQIQSKINKIQSYHQKIESLLDMVKVKQRTPLKNTGKNESLMPSRSLSKVTTPSAASGLDKSYRQITKAKQISLFDGIQKNKSLYPYEHKQQKKTMEYDISKVLQQRKNRYLRQDKQVEQSNRKKSKQYMKSIQGQVRDIQNTIQQLNKKIKQTQGLSFRKQINFDNLSSTSNPQSFSQQNKQKFDKNISQIYQRSNYNKQYQQKSTLTRSPARNKTPKQIDSLKKYERSTKYVNPYEASVETSQERRFSPFERFKMRKTDKIQTYETPQKNIQRRKLKQIYQKEDNSSNKKMGLIYKQDKY